MKKLSKDIYVSLSPVSLYLEDIERIEEVFRNNCKSYAIFTEEYEFDSIEELKQSRTLEFCEIRFISREPRITLNILSSYTSISASEDDAVSAGIVTKLKDLLEPKSVQSPLIVQPCLSFLLIICSIIFFQKIIKLDSTIKHTISFIEIILICGIIYNAILNYNANKRPIFYAKNITPKVNLFFEYKKQIMLLMIGAFLSVVGQVLFQLIKEKIFKTK